MRNVQRFAIGMVALLLVAVAASPASADPGDHQKDYLGILDLATQTLIGADDDLFATVDAPSMTSDPGTTHFGPYPSTSSDSGFCGNEWATDQMNRFFQIRQIGPQTYRVIEKFRDGTFTVPSFLAPAPTQPSPGSCDSSDGTGPGAVNAGVTGAFHGYDLITISAATVYSPSTASCPPPCFSTNDFLITVFPAGYVRSDDAFFFHYLATNQSTLVYHEWRNASCSRGGNHGDIQSVSVGSLPPPAVCP
jgi:hypothetical protein